MQLPLKKQKIGPLVIIRPKLTDGHLGMLTWIPDFLSAFWKKERLFQNSNFHTRKRKTRSVKSNLKAHLPLPSSTCCAVRSKFSVAYSSYTAASLRSSVFCRSPAPPSASGAFLWTRRFSTSSGCRCYFST